MPWRRRRRARLARKYKVFLSPSYSQPARLLCEPCSCVRVYVCVCACVGRYRFLRGRKVPRVFSSVMYVFTRFRIGATARHPGYTALSLFAGSGSSSSSVCHFLYTISRGRGGGGGIFASLLRVMSYIKFKISRCKKIFGLRLMSGVRCGRMRFFVNKVVYRFLYDSKAR